MTIEEAEKLYWDKRMRAERTHPKQVGANQLTFEEYLTIYHMLKDYYRIQRDGTLGPLMIVECVRAHRSEKLLKIIEKMEDKILETNPMLHDAL